MTAFDLWAERLGVWMVGSLAWLAICVAWLIAHKAEMTLTRLTLLVGPTVILGLSVIALILIAMALEAK